MAETTTITVRLAGEVKDKLDKLARSTRRSRSFLAAEAIEDFVALNAWQVAEIEAAVAEADAGDFADESEVAATFSKWSR